MRNILHHPEVFEAKTQDVFHDKDFEQTGVGEIEERNFQVANVLIVGVFAFLIFLGIGTGFVLAKRMNMSESDGLLQISTTKQDSKKSVGVSDMKAFPDSATGILESGGLNGEGTHKLIRDGGPSQTVYIISSVVDLDQFIGKNVTVWGQTMAAKKAPWFMDVGRVDMKE